MHVVTYRPAPRDLPGNIVDRLPHWLDRVLQRDMTVLEAIAAYGEHRHGPGRKRQFGTFAVYLADRVRFAETSPAITSCARCHAAPVTGKQAPRTMCG